MATILQDSYIFDTSVKENIRIANPLAGEDEIITVAKAARAHKFIQQFSDGYNTRLGESGAVLSGGQKTPGRPVLFRLPRYDCVLTDHLDVS